SRRSRCSACSRQVESGPPDTATRTRSPERNMACWRTVAVTRSRTLATAGGRRWAMSVWLAGRSDPGQPLLRLQDLGHRRQVGLVVPHPVEALHAGAVHDLGHEPLPHVVLADLRFEPDQPLERALQAGRAPAP